MAIKRLSEYLTVTEASALLGVQPETVRRLARAGLLPAYKAADRWLVSGRELEEFARGYPGRRGRPSKGWRSGQGTAEYTLIDLFAGAGGITAGFCSPLGDGHQSFEPPFRSVLAIDNNVPSCRTYAANFGNHVIAGRIEDIAIERLEGGRHRFYLTDESDSGPVSVEVPGRVDVVVGGPPCQGFSPLGRMNDWNREDPRNSLWVYYMKVVGELRPAIFLVENVPELLTSRQGQAILDEAHALGYYLAEPRVLDASRYGVPQKRRRAFILGSRIGPIELPEPTEEVRTVADAFRNLPDPENDPLHILRNPRPESLERYRAIPEGGNRFDLMERRPDLTPRCWLEKPTGSTDVMGRLWADRPSVTIRTEFFKPEKGRYLHPTEHRPITHREAAVLQTFPSEFVFEGSKIEIARQIGNAVPPVLAYHIAQVIHRRLADPLEGHEINETPNLEALRGGRRQNGSGQAEAASGK